MRLRWTRAKGAGVAEAVYVAVVGPGRDVSPDLLAEAKDVGRLLAQEGCTVVTGGLGGVMEAASQGAYAEGGLTVGLLPGSSRTEGNDFLTVALPTGLGEMRNALVVRSCHVVICVGGSWGTLSEVALAVRTGVPVVALHGWQLPEGLHAADDAVTAVRTAMALVSDQP